MRKIIIPCLLLFFSLSSLAQIKAVIPDLSEKDNLTPVNRQFTLSAGKVGKTTVHLNAADGPGVVWINDLTFSTGSIEFDVKGKDVLQESFVGIAFHGMNDSTYEGVYLRPFNFQASDTLRKKHAVQYIALPKFDWPYLRETYPDKYEHPLLAPIDPNDWFHVKIIVDKHKIRAFVNSDAKACLSVEPLTGNLSGKIGFWVGNHSDGDFTNLVVKQN